MKRPKSGCHNYRHNEINTCDGYCLYSVEIIFTRSPHYQSTFPTHAWNTLCRSRETLCWSVGALHSRCVSARRPQNGVLGVHPSVGQRDEGQREDEGEESTLLLQFPLLSADRCAVWRCHASALDSYSCSAEPFEIIFFHLLQCLHLSLGIECRTSPQELH